MAFEGFDVEAQPERRADLTAFGVQRVPATIVGDRIVHGWNPQALAELVGVVLLTLTAPVAWIAARGSLFQQQIPGGWNDAAGVIVWRVVITPGSVTARVDRFGP